MEQRDMIVIPTEKRFDWKHTPTILFGIVLLNTLIFFLYQSGDSEKSNTALTAYVQNGYLAREWPLFEEYLISREEKELLSRCRQMHSGKMHDQLSATILMRPDFYKHLNTLNLFGKLESFSTDYIQTRERLNKKIKTISYYAYGLTPNEFKISKLLSYQFLHGDILHLLGNMFFLVICGFAVEAALGHLRFLVFYLISGLVGGLLHALFESQSATPLVGASGSVSGAMAMYLGVFRFKKIEFFYWLFVFVGYIRVPALLILPFYIGKELYSYYSEATSNVAFMAHTGGFISGASLLMISLLLKPDILNEEYIEEDQSIDPKQEALAKIYALLGKYQFANAYSLIDEFIDTHGVTFDLLLLKYKLSKTNVVGDRQKDMLKLLQTDITEEKNILKVEQVWLENPNSTKLLGDEKLIKLGMRLSSLEAPDSAEKIFRNLYQNKSGSRAMSSFARRLSLIYEHKGHTEKQRAYEKIAEALMLRNV